MGRFRKKGQVGRVKDDCATLNQKKLHFHYCGVTRKKKRIRTSKATNQEKKEGMRRTPPPLGRG